MTKLEPHPYHCQVEGCIGRLGQAILDLGERGQLRVCLYHYVLVHSVTMQAAGLPQ